MKTDYLINAIYQTPGWKSFQRKVNGSGTAVAKFQRTTKASGGKIKKTFTEVKGRAGLVNKAVGEVNKTGKISSKTFQKLHKSGAKFNTTQKKVASSGNDLTRALRRVAIVVPVWGVLRGIIQGVSQTLKQGLEYWKEYTTAIEKAKRTITDVGADIGTVKKGITEKIKELSKETGYSMADLANSFYRFSTVGLNVEESMQGMEASTKLAMTMFGDNEQIAKILAQAYRLLADNMEDTIPAQKKMELIGAQIYTLWQDNAFELDGFTESLKKFLPTANSFNFTVTETNALLASLNTLAIKNGRAGRLLRTNINKMMQNAGDLAKTLGVHVNPQLDSTFDVFMKILGAINKLDKQEFPLEKFKKLDIFGGVRSREVAVALSGAFDILQDNLETINPTLENQARMFGVLGDSYKDRQDDIDVLLEKQSNLRKQLGQAFIKGITGADDFAEGLTLLNNFLDEKLIPGFESLGKGINSAFNLKTFPKRKIKQFKDIWYLINQADVEDVKKGGTTFERWAEELTSAEKNAKNMSLAVKGMRGELDTPILEELVNHFSKNKDKLKKEGVEVERILVSLQQQLSGQKTNKLVQEGFWSLKPTDKDIKESFRLDSVVKENIKSLRKQLKIIEAQSQGASSAKIAYTNLKNKIDESVQTFNKLDRVQQGTVDKLKTAEILSMALEGRFQDIHDAFQGNIDASKEYTEWQKLINKLVKKENKLRQSLTNTMISEALNLAQLRGASSRQQVEMAIALEKQLGINQDAVSQLKKQFDLEQAITKEVQNRYDATSETLKLYEIAQKFGEEEALTIRKALKDKSMIGELEGRTESIFRKFFGGDYKQYKAREYFRKEAPQVPIEEKGLPQEDLRNTTRSIARALKGIQFRPNFEVVNNINIDGKRISSQIIRDIKTEIKKGTSDIRKDIRESVQEDLNRGDIR